jgi:hypothetical protein
MSSHADSRDLALAKLREELARSGWKIVHNKTPDALAISISHDLSTDMTLVMSERDDRPPALVVGDFLESHEVRAIARAPRDMPHRGLVGAIRTAAAGGQWRTPVVTSIARLLRGHGILTDSESLWLEEAGVPWRPTDDANGQEG